jgi:predicted dehydrogenase
MTTPLNVGLIGAGPWARTVTGPVLAAGPQTCVTGVWSRTDAHATELAAQLDVPAFEDVDELLANCDAVAIAVAPDAQPHFAVRAARAGKALLLEKPLAGDVAGAEMIAGALQAAGTGALVMLSSRFNPALDDFVAGLDDLEPLGARACFISGAFLGGAFAHGWRLERGAVLDVGPHLLDLLEAALGEIVDVWASGDLLGWSSLVCSHASGATSSGSLCCTVAGDGRTEVEVFGRHGTATFNGRIVDYGAWANRVRDAFSLVARGEAHPANVERAFRLQHLIARIESQLGAHSRA